MTQTQLDAAVATATGESIGLVRSLGFSLVAAGPDDPESGEMDLVLDCPTCGRPVAFPGRAGDGSPALAECHRCDAYFAFGPEDPYVSGTVLLNDHFD